MSTSIFTSISSGWLGTAYATTTAVFIGVQSFLIAILQGPWVTFDASGHIFWLLPLIVLSSSLAAAAFLLQGGVRIYRRVCAAEAREADEVYSDLLSAREIQRVHRARMHEVTSTLAGIRSASELLCTSETLDPDRRVAMMSMMGSELRRLERLVRAQRGGADTAPVDAGVVDVDMVLHNLALAHEAGGTTVVHTPSTALAAGSSDAVAEILNVLIDNAAKHGSGAVEVAVRHASETSGPMVVIEVSDDGSGVAPEVHDRIFEWGVRGPDSGGQGIGLNVAHKLAARMGGSLRLAVRARTTFVVTLPSAVIEGHPVPATEPAAGSEKEGAADGVVAA
ncbi:signal transduction histidine kinase [Nocardioides albertanoniae]|uniref:histidine kinase n=1 Tax=Nocardioides albertanoniae TaxID=1175486 RepID=A0A543A3W1_9ACTN|nr:HAMP domain-containing sensor histidine kinase [Nocardioides albertanoniae]TQL67267.1 signal transduction histidine kinase [Nocardioides albertanoniae]